MWICLPDAFLSIVHKDCKPDQLLVRARRPGDIERVFPGVKVRQSLTSDYRYRAVVSRNTVAAKLAEHVAAMAYGNFKATVLDHRLHGAYSRVWSIMSDLQPTPPYAGERRASGSLFDFDDDFLPAKKPAARRAGADR